jgi:Fe-S cluster biogenesis protein NfuA
MFIQTEETPNPATLKFLPGRDVMGAGTAEYRSEEEAQASPLAEALFDVDGVTSVFLGGDFVTVAKRDDKEWYLMKPAVLGAIMEFYTSGKPVVLETQADHAEGDGGEDSEVVSQIKELLDTRVRPAVAQDGGDIVFDKFEDGVVTLFMRGACAGCPSSTATLKMGIENMLRHYIPEVREVRAGLL